MDVTKLRIWHIANVPGKAFRRDVKDIEEAKLLLRLLWDYDNHLGDDLIGSNASGLEIFNEKDKEWEDYHNEEDQDIMEICDEEDEKRKFLDKKFLK